MLSILLALLLAVPRPSVPILGGPPELVGPQTDGAADVSAAVDPLTRVALLGASATAGFNLEAELGTAVDLGHLVALALGLEPDSLFDRSDGFTFLEPRERTAPGLAAVREHEPTLTLAIDLPFWFVHGRVPEQRRLAELEWLLARLEDWPGELFLGTVPRLDAEVSERMVPPVLRASDATVDEANRRLAAWVAARERVHLVPMAELFAELRAGRPPAARGAAVHPDDAEGLLQEDGLHPTALGTALLALVLLDRVDRALDGALGDRVRFDLDALVDGIESR